MDRRHWITLELPKILERLASYASFSAGADKARSLTPSTLLSEVRERLQITTEARALLQARPQTGLGGVTDVRPFAEAARHGATLLPTDLLDVRGTLLAARSVQQSLTRLDRQFPLLADIAGRIALCPDLAEEIGRCLDDRGEVRDDASPELASLRRELRLAHDRLIERLQRIIASPRNGPYLQDPIITIRDGRYVIPLKADFKGRIRGVVHDRSSSGVTLFIEPLAVVDLNNAWKEFQVQEGQEVQRILAHLSASVAAYALELVHTVDALADLDLAFAKANYAADLDAVQPTIQPADQLTIRLPQARHPLLDPATVVPIDVVLDEATRILVITGPNTGGKTVTLKTTGLLALMAQTGLHVPAARDSALSVFEAIYADIGDEQSIEQSLSTFSSHLTNILSFLNQTDGRSLVLLDELGAGTDPVEGSALARALLETLRSRGVTTLVATHYPELKAYAQLTPGVMNACVEFDPQTLRPTYRLSIGLPGRSNAFAIARRLGLDEAIARQAEELVSQESRQTEGLLADLHRLRLQAVQARDAAAANQSEARRVAQEARQQLAGVERERAQIMEDARQEAAAELERFRQEIEALRQELLAAEARQEAIAAAQEQLETLEEEVATPIEVEPPPPPVAPPPDRPIRRGDLVRIEPLQTQGRVTDISGEQTEVQVGTLRIRVGLAQLTLLGPPPEPVVEPIHLSYEAPHTSMRLDLRGCLAEDALEQLDHHLDAASLAGLPWVQIVHGKGTGALRRAVREFLRSHPLVASFRAGDEGEGGEGITVARLLEA